METSREDFGIAIRSAFLKRGVQQRFSLFALVVLSVILLFIEKIETKPLNYLRSIVKDVVYRSSVVVSAPTKGLKSAADTVEKHMDLYNKNVELKQENLKLKANVSDSNFLKFENKQLRKLLDEDVALSANLVSSRVMLDKQSPYLNSFIINSGTNKKIKNGLAVLDGENFIGRIVDVNFFSSRILLVTDLNSKISIISEPSGNHAILTGHGGSNPTLEYLSKNHKIKNEDKIYTSGKEGIFVPGIPIGEVKVKKDIIEVELYSELDEITFVNINLEAFKGTK